MIANSTSFFFVQQNKKTNKQKCTKINQLLLCINKYVLYNKFKSHSQIEIPSQLYISGTRHYHLYNKLIYDWPWKKLSISNAKHLTDTLRDSSTTRRKTKWSSWSKVDQVHWLTKPNLYKIKWKRINLSWFDYRAYFVDETYFYWVSMYVCIW